MCKKFDISPITAMVNIHKKSLSRTMATYFQSSRTLLESSARLTLSLSILDLKIYIQTNVFYFLFSLRYVYQVQIIVKYV